MLKLFSGKDNLKSTKDNPVVDFDACLGLIKEIVVPLVQPKPTTLNHHQISAFSYFFERAIETGLIGMHYNEAVPEKSLILRSFIPFRSIQGR